MANGRCPQCNNLVLKGNVTQGSCEVECERCKHHFVLKPLVTTVKTTNNKGFAHFTKPSIFRG